IHVDGRLPGNGDALGVVEFLQFFELFLDALGDLIDGVLDSCAGPLRRDNHRFDGEFRVFFAAKVYIGHDARNHAHDHEVPDDRRVIERNSGKIKLFLSVSIGIFGQCAHCCVSSGVLTDCPGTSECTPAVTTRSPGSSPAVTIAAWLSRLKIFTSRSDTVLAAGSTIQACCFPSCSKSAAAGILMCPVVCSTA